jgi:hypothetical protein
LFLRELAAKALFNKGDTLDRLSQSNAAKAAYNDVIARFGAAAEPGLTKIVAMARRRLLTR